MNIIFDVNLIANTLAIVGIGYVAKIVRQMNGSIRELLQWRQDHMELCNERHRHLERRIERRDPPGEH